MKLTAILASAGALFAKIWRIIKAASKLKALKKEVLEAYQESEIVYKSALNKLAILKSFLKEDSDGGKKLTGKEIAEATKLLTELTVQIKKASKEIMEAKDEIKKVIDSFKK